MGRGVRLTLPVLAAVIEAHDRYFVIENGEYDCDSSFESDDAQARTQIVSSPAAFAGEFEACAIGFESRRVIERRALRRPA